MRRFFVLAANIRLACEHRSVLSSARSTRCYVTPKQREPRRVCSGTETQATERVFCSMMADLIDSMVTQRARRSTIQRKKKQIHPAPFPSDFRWWPRAEQI